MLWRRSLLASDPITLTFIVPAGGPMTTARRWMVRALWPSKPLKWALKRLANACSVQVTLSLRPSEGSCSHLNIRRFIWGSPSHQSLLHINEGMVLYYLRGFTIVLSLKPPAAKGKTHIELNISSASIESTPIGQSWEG